MTIKIVPLPSLHGIAFDVILPDGFIKTITMDDYELRAYRGMPQVEQIKQKVFDFLEQNDYPVHDLLFIFC